VVEIKSGTFDLIGINLVKSTLETILTSVNKDQKAMFCKIDNIDYIFLEEIGVNECFKTERRIHFKLDI
jgi:hypothetical protein